jgi:ABC-type nitrate/sulfonate/bicarbonate transport system ATPase subunit
MMREPVLIFMDESFGALDAQTREQLQEDFLKMATDANDRAVRYSQH